MTAPWMVGVSLAVVNSCIAACDIFSAELLVKSGANTSTQLVFLSTIAALMALTIAVSRTKSKQYIISDGITLLKPTWTWKWLTVAYCVSTTEITYLLLYLSTKYISSADAYSLELGSALMVTPIASYFFCAVKTDSLFVVALVTTLSGVLLVIHPSFIFGVATLNLWGAFLATASGTCAGVRYALVAKLCQTADSEVVTYIRFLGGTLFLAIVYVFGFAVCGGVCDELWANPTNMSVAMVLLFVFNVANYTAVIALSTFSIHAAGSNVYALLIQLTTVFTALLEMAFGTKEAANSAYLGMFLVAVGCALTPAARLLRERKLRQSGYETVALIHLENDDEL